MTIYDVLRASYENPQYRPQYGDMLCELGYETYGQWFITSQEPTNEQMLQIALDEFPFLKGYKARFGTLSRIIFDTKETECLVVLYYENFHLRHFLCSSNGWSRNEFYKLTHYKHGTENIFHTCHAIIWCSRHKVWHSRNQSEKCDM